MEPLNVNPAQLQDEEERLRRRREQMMAAAAISPDQDVLDEVAAGRQAGAQVVGGAQAAQSPAPPAATFVPQGPSPTDMIPTETSTTSTGKVWQEAPGFVRSEMQRRAKGELEAQQMEEEALRYEANARNKKQQLIESALFDQLPGVDESGRPNSGARIAAIGEQNLADWSKSRSDWLRNYQKREDEYYRKLEEFEGKDKIQNWGAQGTFGRVLLAIGAAFQGGAGNPTAAVQVVDNIIARDTENQLKKLAERSGRLDAEAKVFQDIMSSHKDQDSAVREWQNLRMKQAIDLGTKLLDTNALPDPMAAAKFNAELMRKRMKVASDLFDNSYTTRSVSTTTKKEMVGKVQADLSTKGPKPGEPGYMDLSKESQSELEKAHETSAAVNGAIDEVTSLIASGDDSMPLKDIVGGEQWGQLEVARQSLVASFKRALGDETAMSEQEKKYYDMLNKPGNWTTKGNVIKMMNGAKSMLQRAYIRKLKSRSVPLSQKINEVRALTLQSTKP